MGDKDAMLSTIALSSPRVRWGRERVGFLITTLAVEMTFFPNFLRHMARSCRLVWERFGGARHPGGLGTGGGTGREVEMEEGRGKGRKEGRKGALQPGVGVGEIGSKAVRGKSLRQNNIISRYNYHV